MFYILLFILVVLAVLLLLLFLNTRTSDELTYDYNKEYVLGQLITKTVAKVDAHQSLYKYVGQQSGNEYAIYSQVVDAQGNIYVAGLFDGTIQDFNGISHTANLTGACFIVKLTSDGQQVWYKQADCDHLYIPSPELQIVNNVLFVGVALPAGNPAAAITDFNGDVIVAPGERNIGVARLNTDTGTQEWMKLLRYRNLSYTALSIVANETAVYFSMQLNLSTGTNTDFSGNVITNGNQYNWLLARLESDTGTQSWIHIARSNAPPSSLVDTKGNLKLDIQGNLYAAGTMVHGTTMTDFSGTAITNSIGKTDVFVAKLQPNGTQSWFALCGGNDDDALPTIAIGVHHVFVTAAMDTTTAITDFSGTQHTGQGQIEVCMASLSISTGAQQWWKMIGGTTESRPVSIKVDHDENVILAAILGTGSRDFENNALTIYGPQSFTILKTDTTGTQSWAKTSGSQHAGLNINRIQMAIEIIGENDVAVSGWFQPYLEMYNFNATLIETSEYTTFITRLSGIDGSQQYIRLCNPENGPQSSQIHDYLQLSVHGQDIFVTAQVVYYGEGNSRPTDYESLELNPIYEGNNPYIVKITNQPFSTVVGLSLGTNNNGITKYLAPYSTISGDIFGMLPSSSYYWNGQELTTTPSSIFVGFTNSINEFMFSPVE